MRPSLCVCPPSTPHTSRALSTTMADLGSDLVGQAPLWGCHSTGKDGSCWVTAGLLCLAQSRHSRNVYQRKSRVQRRMMGHSEGTVEMRSSQEGLLQVPRTQHSPDLERETSFSLLCLPEHKGPLRCRGAARLASEKDQICHLQLLSHGPQEWIRHKHTGEPCPVPRPLRSSWSGQDYCYAGETVSWCNLGADAAVTSFILKAGQAGRHLYLY